MSLQTQCYQNHWGQIYHENNQIYKYFHLCAILVSAHRASSVASSFLTDWWQVLCEGCWVPGIYQRCTWGAVEVCDLVLLETGVSGGCDLMEGGGLDISPPKRDLLYLGMASFVSWGMISDSFLQSNLVDRQINGATRWLLSMLAEAVLLRTVF